MYKISNKMSMHIKVTVITLLVYLLSQVSGNCILNDVGNTPGECMSIRKCKYQIGRLRVGASVSNCRTQGEVCCPTQPTVAETKCQKWKQMLLAPSSFDQSPFKEPKCAAATSTEFIVGGRDANPFEYPHSVALGYGPNQNELKYLCGATLISEQYLVTAAHCVTDKNQGKPSFAVIGDRILDPKKEQMSPSPYRKIERIAEYIVHPEYRKPHIYNDIALLRLEKPLELDRYVLPACIATPLTTPKKRNQVEASGWGITDITVQQSSSNILQAINITTIDESDCNKVFNEQPDKPYRYPNGIVKSQICATGEFKDTCNGDSGGGLLIREDKCLFHVVGITSLGARGCGYGSPSLYTNVASYQDWIEMIVFGGGNRGR